MGRQRGGAGGGGVGREGRESEKDGRRKGEREISYDYLVFPHTSGQMDMSTVTQQKEESRKILRE